MPLPLTRALGIALVLMVALLTGCEFKTVKVRLTDLDRTEVQGLHFWRLSEATGEFVRDGTVLLSPIEREDGHEIVHFTLVQPDGQMGLSGPAVLERDARDLSQGTLEIVYQRMGAPAWVRVSAFNDYGESPLSDEEVLL